MEPEELYKVIQLVRPLHLELARAVEMELEGAGLGLGARAVLEVLAAGGALPVPGIATELSLARQVVQRSVDTLREMGLVVAQENPAHRRSVLIGLTKAGRALWRRVHGRELRVLADVGGDLDPKAVQACVRVMGCLQQGFAARNRGRAL